MKKKERAIKVRGVARLDGEKMSEAKGGYECGGRRGGDVLLCETFYIVSVEIIEEEFPLKILR